MKLPNVDVLKPKKIQSVNSMVYSYLLLILLLLCAVFLITSYSCSEYRFLFVSLLVAGSFNIWKSSKRKSWSWWCDLHRGKQWGSQGLIHTHHLNCILTDITQRQRECSGQSRILCEMQRKLNSSVANASWCTCSLQIKMAISANLCLET